MPRWVRSSPCPQAASLLVRQLRLKDRLQEMWSDSGLGDLALGQASVGSILTPSHVTLGNFLLLSVPRFSHL